MTMGARLLTLCAALTLSVWGAAAQETKPSPAKEKKAWEFGLGGSVWQFNRISLSNFQKDADGNYTYDMTNHHALWGGQIYVARELNSHFYLDFQGNLGATDKTLGGKTKWLGQAGLGLQWRLGEYFKSPYIDPFLRVGANYLYKGFDIYYAGDESVGDDQMQWVMSNVANKNGRDKTHMFAASFGGGVNMWLNDRFGIGLQADYLLMPYKNVANSIQGSVRLMWRFGGKSKKLVPVVQYVDRPVKEIVERIVEKPVKVETVVEVERIIETKNELTTLFNQIYFEFDKYTLTPESETILDRIAKQLKLDTSRHFLITGQTDARGSDEYNQTLSRNRARKVVEGLVKRGVPAEMLKYRGVGKRIAAIPASVTNDVRRGDRKTVIELVTNDDYWNYPAFEAEQGSIPEKTGQTETENHATQTRHIVIQLLATSIPVTRDSAHFKGYHNEVTEYVKEGTFKYKYCIGNFADRKAAQRELTVIRKDFPNAFVTEMQDNAMVMAR